MAGVQLIGKDSIMDAYNDLEADAWALYDGKQQIVTGEDSEDLSGWLDRFMQAGSTAVYTLKAYHADVCFASLNVRLIDIYAGQGIAGYGSKLEQRLQGIEKQLKGGSEQDEEDFGDVIMGYFKEPDKLETAIGAIMQIFGKKPQGQAITGSEPVPTGDKLDRLANALDRLEKRDPELVKHMEKLATLADTDPVMFQAVIKKLDLL